MSILENKNMNSNTNKKLSPTIQIDRMDHKKRRLESHPQNVALVEHVSNNESGPSTSTQNFGEDIVSMPIDISESNRISSPDSRNDGEEMIPQEARYVLSERGGNLLINDGYLFRKERTIKTKTYWKCTEYVIYEQFWLRISRIDTSVKQISQKRLPSPSAN